ncbi:MAG: hypothetical protein EBT39_03535 [Sphingobacteriia bacterium]|nr:hypothetical protein [Candidatus Fonsibacter lacus]
MKTSVINQIKTLLGMEVKLETMKLADGITIFEADAFEMDKEVFIVTEDEQKIPVPIGEYELEDGRILVVEVEGIIMDVKDAPTTEEVAPEDEVAPEVPVAAEAVTPSAKKTVESVVKETFFAEIEKLTQENIELKAQIELLSKVDEVANEATELAEVKPIAFNPENTNEVEHFQYGSKRPRTMMDSILEKINK